jgi:hypothetical protein
MLFHSSFVEYVAAEDFGNVDDIRHGVSNPFRVAIIPDRAIKAHNNPIIQYNSILRRGPLQAVIIHKIQAYSAKLLGKHTKSRQK